MKSCREFKELFVGLRENVNRVLGFAKILRKVSSGREWSERLVLGGNSQKD